MRPASFHRQRTSSTEANKMEGPSREIGAIYVDYADIIEQLLASTCKLDITRSPPPLDHFAQ